MITIRRAFVGFSHSVEDAFRVLHQKLSLPQEVHHDGELQNGVSFIIYFLHNVDFS